MERPPDVSDVRWRYRVGWFGVLILQIGVKHQTWHDKFSWRDATLEDISNMRDSKPADGTVRGI